MLQVFVIIRRVGPALYQINCSSSIASLSAVYVVLAGHKVWEEVRAAGDTANVPPWMKLPPLPPAAGTSLHMFWERAVGSGGTSLTDPVCQTGPILSHQPLGQRQIA